MLRFRLSLPLGLMAVLLLVPFAPSALAQTADDALRFSLRDPAVGARGLGMGGTGSAGVADVSAFYTNPAGLGFYEHSEVTGDLSVLAASDESTFRVGDGPSFQRDDTESALRLGTVAGIYKVPTKRGSLVFGLGFTQTSTFDRTLRYRGENAQNSITQFLLPATPQGSEWDVDEDGLPVIDPLLPFAGFAGGAIEFFRGDFENGRFPFEPAVLPGTRIVQEGTVKREGRLNEINIAGAAAVAPQTMIGGSINVTVGRFFFENEVVEIDAFNENDGFEVDSDLDGVSDRFGLERVTFRENFEADFTGVNFRAGLSTELTPNVRLGLVGETPTWISVNEDFTDAFVRTEFSEGSPLTFGDDPEEDDARGTFDYSLRTPWRLGGGLAYTSDRLLVSVDVEFVDWSTLELDSDTFGFPVANEVIDDDFETVLNWRGGIEYEFANRAAVRGGAAYRPDPRAFDIVGTDGERRDRSRLFFSLGTSYPLGQQVALDVGWMQKRTDDQFRPYGRPDDTLIQNGIVSDTAPPLIDEDVARNQVRIGVRYRF